MYGLRVYVQPTGSNGAAGGRVFYCRRYDGPLYKWFREGRPGVWRYSRVRLTKQSVMLLIGARLEDVPAALRTRIGEHYRE